MQHLRLVLIALSLIFSGVVAGYFLAPEDVFPVISPVIESIGLTVPGKRISMGFAPFWLLTPQYQHTAWVTMPAYFSLTVDPDGKIRTMVNDQEEEPGWTTLKGPKVASLLTEAKKHRQKVSLVVHNSSEAEIPELLSKPVEHARNLTASVIPVMREYGFTDLNLDIESFSEVEESTRAAATAFVATVKEDLVREKAGTLSLDMAPMALFKPFLYDVAAIGSIVDHLILMAYDFHYTGSYMAGPVGPVGGGGQQYELDTEVSVGKLLESVPPEKVILGIPLYGYEWDTLSATPSAATVPGSGMTASSRRVAADVLPGCAATGSGCIRQTEPYAAQPYVAIPQEGGYYRLMFYEDIPSVRAKMALAERRKLGGIAMWALGYESPGLLSPVADYIRYR